MQFCFVSSHCCRNRQRTDHVSHISSTVGHVQLCWMSREFVLKLTHAFSRSYAKEIPAKNELQNYLNYSGEIVVEQVDSVSCLCVIKPAKRGKEKRQAGK